MYLQCGRPEFDLWVGKTPGEGNGNLLQYSCLENSMDRRATGWLESMWLQRSDMTEQLTLIYWSFSFSVSPSKNIQVWFRDRFHLLADQRTLKSLLRQHNLKVKFYCAQLSLWSNSHKIIGNTIALTIQSFVLKVMPMLFKMLSSSVIAFLPRSKCLSIL